MKNEGVVSLSRNIYQIKSVCVLTPVKLENIVWVGPHKILFWKFEGMHVDKSTGKKFIIDTSSQYVGLLRSVFTKDCVLISYIDNTTDTFYFDSFRSALDFKNKLNNQFVNLGLPMLDLDTLYEVHESNNK